MGIIYLLRTEGTTEYKIGITTTTIEKRIKSLQTGNGNKIIIVSHFKSKYHTKIERTLHRQLKEFHLKGEWFDLPKNEVDSFNNYCQTIHNNLEFLEESKNPYI